MKIKKYETELEETENYKTQRTIIRSKGKIIPNEEKTNYFLLQEKQKQKKQITISENKQGKSLTTNSF